jgi:hypothetical protein
MTSRKQKKTRKMRNKTQFGGNPKLIQLNELLKTLLKQVLCYVYKGADSYDKVKDNFIKNNNMTGPELINILNKLMNKERMSYYHFPPKIMDENEIFSLYEEVQKRKQKPDYIQAVQLLKSNHDEKLIGDTYTPEQLKAINFLEGDFFIDVAVIIREHLFLHHFFTEYGEGMPNSIDVTEIPVKTILNVFIDENEILEYLDE